MKDLITSTDAWLIPCLVAAVVLFLFAWWMRRRRPGMPLTESSMALHAAPDEERGFATNGATHALHRFFGAHAAEPATMSESPPPRLTMHPLAQIIASARSEKKNGAVTGVESKPPPVHVMPSEERNHQPASPDPLREERSAKDAELERLRAELVGMTSRFKALDKESFIYTAHNKQLEAEIATLRAGTAQADAPLRADLEKLRADLAEARDRLQQAEAEKMKLVEKVSAVAATSAELASARRDLAAAEELLRAAEAAPAPSGPATAQLTSEIGSLRSEIEALRSENETLKTASREPENNASMPGSGKETVTQRMDDLTQIKGIARVINGRLNDHGIFTYGQIALWSDDDVNAFSDLLGSKNRIIRDQWREQARALHAAKHGDTLPGL